MGTPTGSRQEGRIERGEIPAIVLVREASRITGTFPMTTIFPECWRSYSRKDGETSFPNIFSPIVGWTRSPASEFQNHSQRKVRLHSTDGIISAQSCLGWAEIKAPVLAFMESRKARRFSQEQRERLSTRVTALRAPIFAYKRSLHPTDDFIPLVSDVCWVPDILDTTLTGDDESFAALVEGLPDRLPQLSTEICGKRAEQIISILPWDGTTPDSLDLAIAWFTCWWCNAALRHQEVSKHMCFRIRHSEVTRPQAQLTEFTGNPWTWPTEKILFAGGISRATRKVVLACGGDPDKMTHRELDDIPCRIAWFQGALSLQVIDWRQLVRSLRTGGNRHSPDSFQQARKLQAPNKEKEKGKDPDKPEWRVLKLDELPEFRQHETPSEKMQWSCMHCWRTGDPMSVGRGKSFSEIKTHIMTT